MLNKKGLPAGRQGFTLLEMYMTMTILVLVVGVLVFTFLAGQTVFNNEKNISDASLETARAVNLMSNEIRSGKQVTTASTTSFIFTRDTGGTSEVISYSWNGVAGGNLVKTTGGNSMIISKNVTNFNLTYNSATLSNIETVTIKLTNAFGNQMVTAESSVNMRNKL